jgi:hypothetical protein
MEERDKPNRPFYFMANTTWSTTGNFFVEMIAPVCILPLSQVGCSTKTFRVTPTFPSLPSSLFFIYSLLSSLSSSL